ncbi:MAG: glycosyltransferase [Calothrix sp. C42_A2020_038]|nr:glycosyltransferase [Calothrix sp. C42_A2020_038]
MKILQVIPSVSPAMGGPTHAILNQVKALRQAGINTEIATTNDNGSTLLDVPLLQRTEYQKIPIWFFSRVSPRMKDFIFSADLTSWLWKNIQNYDLVATHYLFSYAPTCAGAIARRHKIPYIVRTIGQLSPWALAQGKLKKQAYSSLIERRNLNRAAAVHCTSIGEAEDVRNFGVKTPIVTLPLGINQPNLLPGAKQKLCHVYNIPEDTSIVLFLSRLHPKKRPDLLIKALSHIAKHNIDFHLIVAGSGKPEYEAELKNLAASNGIINQTTFAGFVTGQDKDLILQGSDIFALPSFSENFGVAIAEAMVVGLPVVITPGIQISPDVANAEAGLVVDGELEPVAQALAKLLKSPNLRRQLGENGKKLVQQQYSWEVIARNLASVYSAIVNHKPLPDTFISRNA